VERLFTEHVVISLDEYQRLALRTAKQLDHQHALEHAALGLVSDAGELASAVKAHVVYGQPLDMANLVEECGDVLWFTAYAADAYRVQLSVVATHSEMASRDSSVTLQHRALQIAYRAARFAMSAAFPEYAAPEAALGHLSLLLEYLERVMDHLGLTFQQVARANLTKLRLRYPERYTDAAAQVRADKLEALPDYGDHRPLADFRKDVELGLFNDYDGHGCYATADRMSDVGFSPSELLANPRSDFTHVVWFNK